MFVQKFVPRREAAALEVVADVASVQAMPLGRSEDAAGRWVLLPFIHGDVCSEFRMPNGISRTLAEVHVACEGRMSGIRLPEFDERYAEGLLAEIDEAFARAKSTTAAVRARLALSLIHI